MIDGVQFWHVHLLLDCLYPIINTVLIISIISLISNTKSILYICSRKEKNKKNKNKKMCVVSPLFGLKIGKWRGLYIWFKYKQKIALYNIHVILYGNIILAKYAKSRIWIILKKREESKRMKVHVSTWMEFW